MAHEKEWEIQSKNQELNNQLLKWNTQTKEELVYLFWLGLETRGLDLAEGLGSWGTKIALTAWMVLVTFVALMFKWTTSTVTSSAKFAVIASWHISAIMREARCVNRHTIILVWKLLRSYPKLKVYIAPREISRFFLLQVTEIGITVNPICPFFCQVSHHLPILHVGWSFCWKFRSIYSNKIPGKQKSRCQYC